MHICGDEIMALMALVPGLTVAWKWLQTRLTRSRS